VRPTELVADDVARVVPRILVMSRVLVIAETRYKHKTIERKQPICSLLDRI